MFTWTVSNKQELIGEIKPILFEGEWFFRAYPFDYLDVEVIEDLITDLDSLPLAVEYLQTQWEKTCDCYAEGIGKDLPAGWVGNPEWEPTPTQLQLACEVERAVGRGNLKNVRASVEGRQGR